MATQSLTIETVKRTEYVRGEGFSAHVAATVSGAPHRLGKRATFAHMIGLQFVKSLGASAARDTPYIGVFDSQRRLLAAWRAMDGLPGYTGTNDRHPLLRGRSMFYRR